MMPLYGVDVKVRLFFDMGVAHQLTNSRGNTQMQNGGRAFIFYSRFVTPP